MPQETIPALAATRRGRDNPLTRSVAGMIGAAVLALLVLVCVGSLPWTLGKSSPAPNAPSRYEAGELSEALLPPHWAPMDEDDARKYREAALIRAQRAERVALLEELGVDELPPAIDVPAPSEADIEAHMPSPLLGTDKLGRSLLVRCLAGGGVSIGIGIAAAMISVVIGTLYGALAGYVGGRLDSVLMRIVDILYGLPYVLLVVLLAVAGEAWIDDYVSRRPAREAYVQQQAREQLREAGETTSASAVEDLLASRPELEERWEEEAAEAYPPRAISEGERKLYEVMILLVAIGGVSWLTMARVVRGQVLSLKEQPFMESARAIGVPVRAQFVRHLLPNLLGPIIVYATLTVPQAILQESFLSFLGIGVQPPLPSWGNLAADGLNELNPVKARWWLILFPCLLLGITLLALNFVGEGLREAFDPKRARK